MIDPRTPITDIERLGFELMQLKDKVADLASPSGTEAYRSVAKLQALVDDIQQQLDDYLSNDAYTKAQVDNLVANPGTIAPADVNASGRGTFPVGVDSEGVYNTLVTYGGSYRATWTHVDGTLGYAPSSRRFKIDEGPADFTVDEVLALHGVLFRYISPAPYHQEQQRQMVGMFAEDVAALGPKFDSLVDRDEEGEPFGLRYDLLSVVLLEGFRSLVAEVRGIPSGD